MALYEALDQTSVTFGSPRLFHIACTAAVRAQETSQDVLVAAFFSAATLDALIFELLQICDSPLLEKPKEPVIKQALVELEKLNESRKGHSSLLQKIQACFNSFEGRSFDKEDRLYRDLELLIKLRNRLVHHRPATMRTIHNIHKREAGINSLLGNLSMRELIDPVLESNSTPWVTIISTPGIAQWSCKTVLDFANRLHYSLPPSCIVKEVIGHIFTSIKGHFKSAFPAD
jgi:hypothetical protein